MHTVSSCIFISSPLLHVKLCCTAFFILEHLTPLCILFCCIYFCTCILSFQSYRNKQKSCLLSTNWTQIWQLNCTTDLSTASSYTAPSATVCVCSVFVIQRLFIFIVCLYMQICLLYSLSTYLYHCLIHLSPPILLFILFIFSLPFLSSLFLFFILFSI